VINKSWLSVDDGVLLCMF